MKCFAIEPNSARVLNPSNPDAVHPTDCPQVEIVLGNAIKKNIYFAVEYRDRKYYVTAVTRAMHDDADPLGERRYEETDPV